MKKNTKLLVLIIALIILVAVIQGILKLFETPQKVPYMENTTKTEQEAEETLTVTTMDKLKKMGERDRMETYFAEYIKRVENGQYEQAYVLLNQDFRNTYFPTAADFEKYVKDKYPKMIAVKYNDIERQGDYYILFIKIINPLNNKEEDTFTQRFVINERNFNDFELSFSV